MTPRGFYAVVFACVFTACVLLCDLICVLATGQSCAWPWFTVRGGDSDDTN